MSRMIAIGSPFAFASTILCAGAAYAQETPAQQQPDSHQLDVIVVTAQKRSESMQDVPIAVSAVAGEKLAALGLQNIDDIRVVMPGVNVRNAGGTARAYIRGVGAASLGALAEPSIALYVDGVYLATATSLLNFNSVSSIEVLKGPQGTLFGRNATGGLIQVTTRDPSFAPTGAFHLGFGNYESVNGDIYVSAPLTDTLAVNFAMTGSTQGEGFGRNLTTGRDVYRNDHNLSFRSKLLYEPTDQTRIMLSGDLSDIKNSLSNTSQFVAGTFLSAGVPVPTYGRKYDLDANIEPLVDTRQYGGALTASHDLGPVSIKSISAYRNTRWRSVLDLDYTAASISSADSLQRDEQFTQELQIQSDTSGRFTWTVGLYYFDASSGQHPSVARITPTVVQRTTSNLTAESIAVYGQGAYKLTDATRLTVGARYTDEKRKIDATIVRGAAVTLDKRKLSFSEPTFRVALDHDFTPTVMGYASFNTGFKSGGFSTNQPAYSPEKLTAYEVGVKSELLDRRLRVNLAGFYYDYKDIQVQAIILGGNRVLNGARGEVYGAEADIEAKLSPSLTLTGGLAWLEAKYKSFPAAPIGSPRGGDAPVVAGSAAGNDFPYAPQLTATLGLTHDWTLESGSIVTNIGALYSSRYYAQPDNLIEQKGFAQVNASIEWQADNGYSMRFWMNNITDYIPMVNATNSAPSGRQVRSWAPPRLYGVTLGYTF
jgi:iron complex outermembrane recepter protein